MGRVVKPAVVFFQSSRVVSPGVFITDGEGVAEMIRASVSCLTRYMPTASAARFCGCCHAWIDGNHGLSVIDAATDDDINGGFVRYGHDLIYLVDVDTGQVSGFNGAKSFTIDNFEKVCPA